MRPQTKFLLFITRNLIWLILGILVLFGILVVPGFASWSNFENILYHSSILGALVLSISIVLISGNFDLSIESTLGFAPMIGALLITRWVPNFSPIAALLVTLIVGAIIGLINGWFVVKVKINAFLQTLAMLIILRGLMLFMIPMTLYQLPPAFTVMGGGEVAGFPVAPLVVFILIIWMYVLFSRRPFGRYLYAVGGNKEAAFTAGVDTDRVTIIAFVLAGIIAAIAGLLAMGRLNAVTNTMGEGMVFMAFAGSVLGGVSLQGGKGRVSGIAAGILVLGVIDNSLNLMDLNPHLIYATKGILIFVAIVLDQLKENVRSWLIRKEELVSYKEG